MQEDDCREQGIQRGRSFEQMQGMYQAMREADDNYDGKLKSASGLVGTDGEKCMQQEKQEHCSAENLLEK